MEPLTVSISSIVGLLATFLQERRGRRDFDKTATLSEYTEWLRRCEHTKTVELLESNGSLASSIQELLGQNQEDLLERFDRLEGLMNQIVGSSTVWHQIAHSINPEAGLSKQAIGFLRWFSEEGTETAFEVRAPTETMVFTSSPSGSYTPPEPRFYKDDMSTLVEAGLLRREKNTSGSWTYTITRAAVALVARHSDDFLD